MHFLVGHTSFLIVRHGSLKYLCLPLLLIIHPILLCKTCLKTIKIVTCQGKDLLNARSSSRSAPCSSFCCCCSSCRVWSSVCLFILSSWISRCNLESCSSDIFSVSNLPLIKSSVIFVRVPESLSMYNCIASSFLWASCNEF